MFLGKIAVAVLLLGAGNAINLPTTLSIHEKRYFVPSEWIKRSKTTRSTILPMRIQIAHRNAALGHDHLMAVSDPASPDFGKHWTPEQVHNFFSPTANTVAKIQQWLASSGISLDRHQVARTRNYIKFDASVDEAEALLQTEYGTYENSETGSASVSCDKYYIPERIKHHIDFVSPTIGFSERTRDKISKRANGFGPLVKAAPPQAPPNRQAAAANMTVCYDAVSPECIRSLYQVPPPKTATPGNEMGMFEADDVYSQLDLNGFFSHYAPNIPNNTSPILQSIDGATAPNNSFGGAESALDLELSFPLLYPQKIKLYQVNSGTSIGVWDPFLDAIDRSFCSYEGGDDPRYDPHYANGTECGVYNVTNVVSMSYSLSEYYYGSRYNDRQCYEYMKLGLMGTSVIVSSGDNGTLSRAGVYGCLPIGEKAQNPGFPSSCPYVTSVGATQIVPGALVNDPEVAVFPNNTISFSSGAGFSNQFGRPSYQDAAVSGFLNSSKDLPPSSTYNVSGRAFPDVSANGWNILIWSVGGRYLDSGTSASAPIFASIINRLNEERIIAGKGPIGFLNPTLYSHPEMFNDIVEGYNLGCDASTAFTSQRGWDPVTGLGTPNFPKMLKVFMSLR